MVEQMDANERLIRSIEGEICFIENCHGYPVYPCPECQICLCQEHTKNHKHETK